MDEEEGERMEAVTQTNSKVEQQLCALQECELEILKEFVCVCKKHGLRFFLVGGTLLGAVRHKGFIPWDDDIDIAMPREDYDRFAELAPAVLQTQYFYQNPDTDPHYFLSYAKIRKHGTEVYEERFKKAGFHKGVFIDIFPLDFCPKPGILCHLLFNVLAVMNYRAQILSGEDYCPYKEWSGKIGYHFLKLLPANTLLKVRRGLLKLSKWLSCGDYVASYAGAYGYYKEVSPWAWFRNTADLQFEGIRLPAPEGTDHILRRSYGERYMELPPENERIRHIDPNGCRIII